MLILWLFLAAALLVLGQRAVFARFWSRRLTVRVEFDRKTAAAGEDVELREQILNRKLLPLPYLRYRYTLLRNFELYRTRGEKPIQMSCRVAVPGRRAVRRSTTLRGLQRGVYTVSEAALEGQDLFYLLSSKKPFYSPARLTVWPAQLDTARLSVPYRRLLGAVLTRRATQEDPFEIRNIRPYEIYDSMRLINWKATAKTGELKVNQQDYTTDESLCLLLDVEHGSEKERETAISAVSSLTALFLRRGVNVSFVSNGRSCIGGQEIRVAAGAGIAHAGVINDALAQIKLGAAPSRPFKELLESLRDKPLNALCAAVSAADGDDVAAAFDALCGRDGGYFLQLGTGCVQGRHFTVLCLDAPEQEAAS